MFWETVLRGLSPSGARARLQVFIFHRVVAERDPLLAGEPDAADFEWMMRFVSGAYHVLPFGEAVARLRRGQLPSAPASITFDDGYRDNATVALPILSKYKLHATFFIATAFLDGGRMWNDDVIEAVRAAADGEVDWTEFGLGRHDLASAAARSNCIDSTLGRLKYFPHAERAQVAREIARRGDLPDSSHLMMDREQVRALRRAGMEIGAHTHSHPILSGLAEGEAEAEIAHGKDALEAILGESVSSFAYPNGNTRRDLRTCHAAMVERCGFQAAAITDWGCANARSNRFLIPRFTPWDRTPMRFALRCTMAMAGKGDEAAHVPY